MRDNDTLDLLVGAEAIGAYLNIPPRNVYWLIEQRHIPTFKIGNLHAARKSELARDLSAHKTERVAEFA